MSNKIDKIDKPEFVVEYEGRSYTEEQLIKNRIASRTNRLIKRDLMLSFKADYPEVYQSMLAKMQDKYRQEAEAEFQKIMQEKVAGQVGGDE